MRWLSRLASCFRYVLASRAPRCRRSQKYGSARGRFVACSRSQFDRLILSFWWTLRHFAGWRASLWWTPWLPGLCTSSSIVQIDRPAPFGLKARLVIAWSTSFGAPGRTTSTRPCFSSCKTYRSVSHVSCRSRTTAAIVAKASVFSSSSPSFASFLAQADRNSFLLLDDCAQGYWSRVMNKNYTY